MSVSGWIGVDLDGTLAEHHGWKGADHIGPPVPMMLARVKRWIREGVDVRIFTARASDPSQIPFVEKWCQLNLGMKLPVTNQKDFAMVELWDDRCVQVQMNTGRRADGRSD